jgi:DNA-directed RNA polymerase specialized sigma24 family protein
MSKSRAVAQHVPYLRRYARALTGSQISGDTYVRQHSRRWSGSPNCWNRRSYLELPLFRLFSTIWNSLAVNSTSDPVGSDLAAERNLAQITPKPRQAFLLIAVEGFSEEQAARILNIDAPTLLKLVEESGRELAAELATDVLIIEDEALIALELEALLENLGHRVIGIARTRGEAVTIARTKSPGLILADIQLADGSSGLDAVNDLLKTFELPVIFITAYPERFLTGERPEPAFLVSKPYQRATVSALVSQALFFERNAVQRKQRAS